MATGRIIILIFSSSLPNRADLERTYLIGILLSILRLMAEGYALFHSIKSVQLSSSKSVV